MLYPLSYEGRVCASCCASWLLRATLGLQRLLTRELDGSETRPKGMAPTSTPLMRR